MGVSINQWCNTELRGKSFRFEVQLRTLGMAFFISVRIKLFIMITLTFPHGNDKSVICDNILILLRYVVNSVTTRFRPCSLVKFTERIRNEILGSFDFLIVHHCAYRTLAHTVYTPPPQTFLLQIKVIARLLNLNGSRTL